jgi:hypothetical protein
VKAWRGSAFCRSNWAKGLELGRFQLSFFRD